MTKNFSNPKKLQSYRWKHSLLCLDTQCSQRSQNKESSWPTYPELSSTQPTKHKVSIHVQKLFHFIKRESLFNNKIVEYVLDLKLPKTARIVDILVDNHEIAFVNASREDDDISHNSDFDVWNSVLSPEKSHRRTGRSWNGDNDFDQMSSDQNDDYDEDDAIDKLLSQAVSPVHLHNHEEENINSQEADNFDVFILPLTIGPRDYVSM